MAAPTAAPTGDILPKIDPSLLLQASGIQPSAPPEAQASPKTAAFEAAAPVAADVPAPDTPAPASPAGTTEMKAPSAIAATPTAPQLASAPAPAPLRALAERTSRPLDLPVDKPADASASGASAADSRAGAASASAASGLQTAPDPTAGPSETAPKAAADIVARSDEPTIDAAPSAENTTGSTATAAQTRETSLSGLSRATIDATAQIAAQILRKLEGRSTRFEMALTPDDLGRVDVKLDIDSEGRLAARLAFDNPAAATDLRGRADELRRELEDAGFHLADDAFEFAERDSGSSSFDRGQNARDGQNRAFAAASRLNAEIDVAQPPRWMALTLSPAGVDLKV